MLLGVAEAMPLLLHFPRVLPGDDGDYLKDPQTHVSVQYPPIVAAAAYDDDEDDVAAEAEGSDEEGAGEDDAWTALQAVFDNRTEVHIRKRRGEPWHLYVVQWPFLSTGVEPFHHCDSLDCRST